MPTRKPNLEDFSAAHSESADPLTQDEPARKRKRPMGNIKKEKRAEKKGAPSDISDIKANEDLAPQGHNHTLRDLTHDEENWLVDRVTELRKNGARASVKQLHADYAARWVVPIEVIKDQYNKLQMRSIRMEAAAKKNSNGTAIKDEHSDMPVKAEDRAE